MSGTPLVGREQELADLTTLLSRARLVTVTGVGGVGKTRLARGAARRVAKEFADGTYLVELSALSDPRLLPDTVAARLGLLGQDATSAWQALLNYLRTRQVLLILDTCEHLLDACATLAETLLQEAPGVTVLATSRQPLDIDGENLCPVAPLRVPDPADGPACGDAVELFARSAALSAPGVALTAEDQADVVTLCRRLDGIPLGIELAAAQLRSTSLADIVARTARTAIIPAQASRAVGDGGDRGDLPARHDPPARHESLATAIGWSYDLCSAAERALWERLSVFAGPFGIEAAEEVCAGVHLPREEILDGLIGLVDKSVLVREDQPGEAEPREAQPREAQPRQEGAARYRMLDTIREFGAAKLAASGIGDGVRGRLLARYLAKARYFSEHILGGDQLDRLRELRAEHDSIRAALEWGLGDPAGPEGQGTALAEALMFYWHAAGLYHEGMHWLGRAIDQVPNPSPERARMLSMRCALGAPAGWGPDVIPDGRAAVQMAEETGDAAGHARAWLYLVNALTLAEKYDEALEAGTQAERLLTAVRDSVGLSFLTIYLGNLHQLRGEFPKSLEWCERGMARFGRSRGRWLQGWLYLVTGFTLAMTPGRQADARVAWGMALRAKCDMGDTVGVAYALEAFGFLAYLSGDLKRGVWLAGAADPLWQRAGARLGGNSVFEDLHMGLITQAREAMGTARFDELFAAGAQAPLSEAVAFALGEAVEPPGQRPRIDDDLTRGEGGLTRGDTARRATG